MRTRTNISWASLHDHVQTMVGWIERNWHAYPWSNGIGIFGVPTGGSVIAALLWGEMMRRHRPARLISRYERGCVIVDDICDSGATLDQFPEALKLVLFCRDETRAKVNYFGQVSDDWIVFPYEKPQAGGGVEVITRMIQLIGDDPKRPGLVDTPARVLRSWGELFAGYSQELPALTTFTEDAMPVDEMVTLANIDFVSTCEHHLLPFTGVAHVGYVPKNGKLIGLSKLARLVDYRSRRLQMQERMTSEIADDLIKAVDPLGVGVVVEGRHLCMVARGIRKTRGVMRTTALRGVMRTDPAARSEFLRSVK